MVMVWCLEFIKQEVLFSKTVIWFDVISFAILQMRFLGFYFCFSLSADSEEHRAVKNRFLGGSVKYFDPHYIEVFLLHVVPIFGTQHQVVPAMEPDNYRTLVLHRRLILYNVVGFFIHNRPLVNRTGGFDPRFFVCPVIGFFNRSPRQIEFLAINSGSPPTGFGIGLGPYPHRLSQPNDAHQVIYGIQGR